MENQEAAIKETLKNWVDEWAQVKKGEKVLITADDRTDKMVLETVTQLAIEKGAKVSVCIDYTETKDDPLGSHVDEIWKPLAPAIFETYKKSDRVLVLGGFSGWGHNYYAACLHFEYPIWAIRLGDAAYRPELLAAEGAKFPREILRLTLEKFLSKVRKGKKYRLTHRLGTDITYEGYPGDWTRPEGNIPTYPTPPFHEFSTHTIGRAVCGLNPPQKADGILVSPFCKDIGGNLSQPLRLTFVDGWCEKVEGGPETEKFLKLMGDERNNRRVQEIMHGFNPKISAYTPDGKITYYGSRGAGNTHFAIGREVGQYKSSQHLTPGFLPGVSFYVDGEPIFDNGRCLLFEDPDLRKAAKKYGNPDELFKQVDVK